MEHGSDVSYLDRILSEGKGVVRANARNDDSSSSSSSSSSIERRVKRDVEERSEEFVRQIRNRNQNTKLVRGDRINFVS